MADLEHGAQDLTRAVVHQWQCDHFGHLNVRHYAAIFDDAIFIFWGQYRPLADQEIAPVSAEIKIGFRFEILPGTIVVVRSRVERLGSKSVTLHLTMIEDGTEKLLSTCEVVEVFFNLRTRMSEHIPEAIRDALEKAS